jgi:hypothetical protein
MKKLLVSTIVMSLLFFASCNKPKKNIEVKNESQSFLVEIKTNKDSAAVAWKRMMSNDDLKFKNMIALLNNISYIPGADEKKVNEIKKEIDLLWKTRYDSTKMRAAIVDGFDSKTSELINKIFELKDKTKGIEKYANISNIQAEITEADNNTLLLDRAHYDKWAKKYNELISKQTNNDSKKALPLFETLN